MVVDVKKQQKFVEGLSMRDMKKRYPMGTYCDVKTHQTISPLVEEYVNKARERYSLAKGGPSKIRFWTGK